MLFRGWCEESEAPVAQSDTIMYYDKHSFDRNTCYYYYYYIQ